MLVGRTDNKIYYADFQIWIITMVWSIDIKPYGEKMSSITTVWTKFIFPLRDIHSLEYFRQYD